jgi:uncharacterized membrane protein YGL010W
MTALETALSAYAAYHRNRRNVATHLVGIPMIVLAVVVLLSRPVFTVASVPTSPAVIASLAALFFYLRLDLRFGLVMAVLLLAMQQVGLWLAALPTELWLGWGLGLFVVGWAFQFVGHGFEGRKPAFVDDLRSLLVGPLFVVAEVAFLLGLRRELQVAISGSSHR